MTLILSRNDVELLLDMESAIEAVEEAFADHGSGKTQIPDRPVLRFEQHRGMIGVMPAYMERMQAAGVKIISHHADNYKRGLPEGMGLVIYNDPETGMPLAIMDCAYITKMRTGAATAVGVKYLAGKNTPVLGIIGTGAQAKPQITAINKVRALTTIKAFDIRPDAAAKFKEQITEPGLHVQIMNNPKDVCLGTDIIVTCTSSSRPIVKEEWLQPGVHITALGADMPHRRELYPGVYACADKLVTDIPNQALVTGEIMDSITEGSITKEDLNLTLGEIVAGKRGGRNNGNDISIFKSTGMAIQDVAVAKIVYEAAIEKGMGQEISITP